MRRILAVSAIISVSAISQLQAATLRTATVLRDDVVRLSDLFEGVKNDRPIGPGPELGGRIFVEAPQLDAIARQFSVDWRSTNAGDRVVLERPGRPFPREQATAALRTALQSAGVSASADLDLAGYAPPMLPPDERVTADVGQLDYDPSSGRFTALLALSAPDMQPVHTRLSGRVQEMVDVPVATRRLLPGDVIASADVTLGHLRADAVRTEIARDAVQAVGMAVRRPVAPGVPFSLADLEHPVVVQKGEAVQIHLEYPGLLISAQGVALDAGAAGDRIRVMNTTSRAVLDAQVAGTGEVRLVSRSASPSLTPGQRQVQVAIR